jgi:hypothetical protein
MLNAIRHPEWSAREADYLACAKRYSREELEQFPVALAAVVDELTDRPRDVLGEVFMEMELGNACMGQYYTPMSVSTLMGELHVDDNFKKLVNRHGFVTAHEPACGSGSTIIGLMQAVQDAGLNYQQCLHVVAIDLDIRAVHMAYVQLTLLYLPAVVVHGNSLTMKMQSYWPTAAHVLGGWDERIRDQEKTAKLLAAFRAIDEVMSVKPTESPAKVIAIDLEADCAPDPQQDQAELECIERP